MTGKKFRRYRRAVSPLDDNPNPTTFTYPRPRNGKFEIRCPNGEVLEFESFTVALQSYNQLKKGI